MLNGPAIDEQARLKFHDEGYLVVPDVVPPELCERVVSTIDEFTRDWETKRFDNLGVVPLHHHDVLWEVRQLPDLYDVFRVIYQRDELWVSMDRVGYKPRFSADTAAFSRARVHWDCDPWAFEGLGVQGLVYLTDTAPDQGAFACAPDVYRNLDAWRAAHEDDENRRHPAIDDSMLVPVPGSAGSLVLFHRLMPHTNLVNTSNRPRYALYVTMQPEGSDSERQQRIREWREKIPPAWARRQKVKGQLVPEPGEPAPLTELGEKLVGITRW